MSTEIRTLLADAAPRPSGPPDVTTIMSRGARVRRRRIVALATMVPVVAGALWAGAHAGIDRGLVASPAATDHCDWEGRTIIVFLDGDARRSRTQAFAAEVRAFPHVVSVEREDLFEKKTTIPMDLPRVMRILERLAFPSWLEIRIDEPASAESVIARLTSPLVRKIAGGHVHAAECRSDRLAREMARLREKVQRLERRLSRKASSEASRARR
jgi:hypothetical protein